MDKKCYCINPSCKCLFGCGCTLADKSVGKCMCCIMEETNQKINKLRRKKTTTTTTSTPSDPSPPVAPNCDCKLGNGRFYDIIVVDDNSNYVSCRYGCSVTIEGNFKIVDWQQDYITDEYLIDINGTMEITTITYKLKNGEKLYEQYENRYYLLFVNKSTLKYAVFYTSAKPTSTKSEI